MVDDAFVDKFTSCINHDLNTPQALALCWELTRGTLSNPTKKATLTLFDNVLGLRLDEWQPEDGPIPDVILKLVERRDEARSEKRWNDADELREQIYSAGFKIEDTPNGTRVQSKRKTIL
jgi:cysteinyl-tRNA synthetase